ncbi:hypothetical protein TrCOL_g447 [Triparma columacea]|uniref:C2HC/C3H-type domain-containing protein n=1 Tax=Triparma columacea TaxID=722753 RepID=A0A9W7GNK5_9STRA|nr:hypothetical protein TrCOL_g447 [Triparma columacea]
MDLHLRRCNERKASERRRRKGEGGRIDVANGGKQLLMGSESLPSLGGPGGRAGKGMAGRTFGKTGYDENFSAPISTGQPEADGRIPCAVCGRKFASDRIGTHQKICRKIKMKGEAEEFDIASKRTKEINDELRFSGGGRGGSRGRKMAGGKRKGGAKFINPATRFGGRGGGGTMASHIESQEATKKKSSWRSQHESFITNVRNAKKISAFLKNGGEAKDLASLPLVQTNDDAETSAYVHCEHCGRSFSELVAQRHIPKCKNIVNRPKPPPGGGFKLNRGALLPQAEPGGIRVHKGPKWGR